MGGTTKLLKSGESTDKLVFFGQEVSPFFVRIVLLLIMAQIIVSMGAPYIWRETNIIDATVNNPMAMVLLTPFLLLGMNRTRLWFYSFVVLLICGAMVFLCLKI